ncbi:hypothetical protein [uncultured Psychroserpens sp.]|uniref:hypothetical protein n=1 Tax=uncultured Psychroserpens sp. TaxID=255436 RepID=UPI002618DF1B|nr:hypothetical protein [uncultured Psychroserpens sp.]
MLYLISGASRSGKTTIAKRIAEQKGISYMSLDWLVMGFTNGIPKYGIHDKLFPNEIAKRIWSFLKAMLESMIWVDVDYIIEGEAIQPELIAELLKKHPDRLKICFVGYTSVSVEEKFQYIKDFSTEQNDWLIDKSDAYIKAHIQNMITHSLTIKDACFRYNINYVDTSKNFEGVINQVVKQLSALR